jgi:hypothetical protein
MAGLFNQQLRTPAKIRVASVESTSAAHPWWRT